MIDVICEGNGSALVEGWIPSTVMPALLALLNTAGIPIVYGPHAAGGAAALCAECDKSPDRGDNGSMTQLQTDSGEWIRFPAVLKLAA
jgi:hypothetical protein